MPPGTSFTAIPSVGGELHDWSIEMDNLRKINNLLLFIARIFSYIGAVLIMVMTALIVLDVILRYFLNRPMLGAHEIIEYLLLLTFFLFITDCWNAGSHVKMEIVYEKTLRMRPLFNAVIGITGALLFSGLAWKVGEEMVYAIHANQVSSELLLPIWPFKLVAILCLLLFILQLAVSVVIPAAGNKKHGAPALEQHD
jgi:TRAP-type transport system small permease protein